jgi:hypothetical protein
MSLSYFYSDRAQQERIARRQTAAAYRANVVPTEEVTRRLVEITTAWPHLTPGEALAFASSPVDITSDEFRQVADMSFERQRKSGFLDRVGDVIGTVAKPVGQALGFVGGVADTALGDLDESVTPATKGAVRTGFVALESGVQELQTFIRAGGYAGVKVKGDTGDSAWRNFLPDRWDEQYEAWKEGYADAGSSSAREAISAMLRGENVKLGSGFLPGGEIEETVRERANRLSIQVGNTTFGGPGNLSITPGRVLAAKVSEPGEQQFNILSGMVDAGVAWFGDPAAALGGVAKAERVSNRLGRGLRAGLRDRQGASAFWREVSHSGLLTGTGKAVDRSLQSRAAEGARSLVDEVTGRITGGGGTRNTFQPDVTQGFLDKQARDLYSKFAETNTVWEIRAATKGKLPVALMKRLADETTEQGIADIFAETAGSVMREAPEFLGFKVGKANRQGVRLLQGMPGNHFDPNDLDDAVNQMDRWLRNAKVPAALRNESIEKVARVEGRESMVATIGDVMNRVADDFIERGIKPGDAGSVKKRARQLTTLWNEGFEKDRAYFMDAIAEDRKVRGVVNGGEALDLQSPHMLTEYLNSMVPLPDAREIRRATSELAKLVDNPFFAKTVGVFDSVQGKWKQVALMRGAYTVRVIGEEQLRMASSGLDSMFAHPISFISAMLGDKDAAAKLMRGQVRQTDILGEHFSDIDEMKAALVRGQTKWDVDGRIFDQNHVLIRPGEADYERAWADGVAELSNDVIASKIAAADGNLEDVKEWFFNEQGRKWRKKLIADKPELAERAGSDAWIEQTAEIVRTYTKGDPTLLDVIATRRFNGKVVSNQNAKGRWVTDPEFRSYFDDVVGPEAVKGQRVVGHEEQVKVWDRATGVIFNNLMTKPTNALSRNPAFRQLYYQRIEEMLPFMDDATRAQVLRNAEGVVDAATFKRMADVKASSVRKKVLAREGEGTATTMVEREVAQITDLDAADTLAKQHALNETKKLLYDASERGQFFDAMRLIFPFGEAWKEVTTRWAKIGMENPRVLRRGQQVITGARGNGFFSKDANGEETFTYPLSRAISKALIGAPVDLKGRVAGLSLMTELLPGVGPVVQVPAAAFLPEESEWNWAREFISPYGEADYGSGFIESFLPGYLKNARQALGSGDARQRNNTVMEMFDYLRSTGDYGDGAEEQARMFEKARSLGTRLYGLRAAAQFFSPTSPLPSTLVEGPEGDDLLVRREVIADLHRFRDETTYGEGTQAFVDRYGVEMLAAAEGMTKSIPPLLPVSKASSDWVRDNKGLVKKYGKSWGFFAPTDEEGMDFTEYARQIESGDRKPLTVEQRAERANAAVARFIYDQQAKKVGAKPTKQERAWLAAVKETLRTEYPGYGRLISGVPLGADLDKEVVPELKRAIADPKLRNTRQAKAIALYLGARDEALAFAEEEYGTKLEAQAAASVREWLRLTARQIIATYPEFESAYDRAFSREVED